jgi:hypothetical protein
MIYTSREIKDRIAIGDNKYRMTELSDGRIMLDPEPDYVHEEGTDINREFLQVMEDRIVLLMNTVFLGISKNPFIIRFNSIDGLIVDGVWNESAGRLEC